MLQVGFVDLGASCHCGLASGLRVAVGEGREREREHHINSLSIYFEVSTHGMCRVVPVDVVLDLCHCPVVLCDHLKIIHGAVGGLDDQLYRITHLSSIKDVFLKENRKITQAICTKIIPSIAFTWQPQSYPRA